jgi:aminoglycoside phosphotransferase (APT) family kinase protein
MGYRLLPGTTGDRFPVDRIDRATSAKRLGELLTKVHGIDTDAAAVRGILTEDWPLEVLLEETMSFREAVFPRLPAELLPLCAPYLDGSCPLPRSTAFHCLVHGDLVDEHILVDADGRVCGVIDWGDSCISDPSQDFAALYTWLGESFVRNVLDHYTGPSDPALMEQITFRARCLALTTFGWSVTGRATSAADRMGMLYQVIASERPD